MEKLPLHEFHSAAGAQFLELNGMETVAHYGDPLAEHGVLRTSAGVFDFSFRSRLVLTGADLTEDPHWPLERRPFPMETSLPERS